MKILIVEDQSTDLVFPLMVAQNLGYETTLVFDGKEALAKATKANFDLIILDWNLPIIGGLEFLELLEAWRSKYHLNAKEKQKIVIHSGQEIFFEDLPPASFWEVVDIWKKPYSAVEMVRKMKTYTHIKRRLVA